MNSASYIIIVSVQSITRNWFCGGGCDRNLKTFGINKMGTQYITMFLLHNITSFRFLCKRPYKINVCICLSCWFKLFLMYIYQRITILGNSPTRYPHLLVYLCFTYILINQYFGWLKDSVKELPMNVNISRLDIWN
jgi:hypothetical protein